MNKGILFSVLLITGALLVVMGALAKIQHWGCGNILLGSGMLLNIGVAASALLPLVKRSGPADRSLE